MILWAVGQFREHKIWRISYSPIVFPEYFFSVYEQNSNNLNFFNAHGLQTDIVSYSWQKIYLIQNLHFCTY